MNKETAKIHIEKNLKPDDSLVGFFLAQKPFKIWLFLFIGPFAAFSMKTYFIAVSKKGIYFHLLNMMGKFANNDFFEYSEIESVKIGKGMLQCPMSFKFRNGRSINIRAQLKGVDRVAKLTEETRQYIQNNIPVVS